MSSDIKLIVKWLASPAAAPSEEDDNYYVLRQSGPYLCQIPVTTNGIEGMETTVASNAKEGSPALYLVLQTPPDEDDEEQEVRKPVTGNRVSLSDTIPANLATGFLRRQVRPSSLYQ
jgi:hypothetical protein